MPGLSLVVGGKMDSTRYFRDEEQVVRREAARSSSGWDVHPISYYLSARFGRVDNGAREAAARPQQNFNAPHALALSEQRLPLQRWH